MKSCTVKYAEDRNEFCIEEFKNPPEDCVPVYAWIWNGVVSRQETDSQLEEMHRMGIRSFYIIPEPKTFRPASMPTLLEPDYLTPAYFEEFRYTIEKAEELGMSAWLYDEGGWPSGGACNRLLYERADLARCTMESRSRICRSGEQYQKAEDAVAAFYKEQAENGIAYLTVTDGDIFEEETEIIEYYSQIHLFESPGDIDIPDLTRKESGETFLELTHEQYSLYMSDLFGKGLRAVFTDEPSGPNPFPFQKEILDNFEKRYGYSILPYLPVLDGKLDIDDNNRRIVLDWYNLCSELFCENYLMSQKRWSNAKGMIFAGHFGGEDDPTTAVHCHYHTMRNLRCMDVPGVDAIWRQIFPIKEQTICGIKVGENKFFPRLASSAAAQVGSRYSVTESNAVYGQGMTFEEMRYVYTFQAIRGINLYNMFSIPYARGGFLMCGEMPNLVEASACYKDMPEFNKYLERLSYLTTLGIRKADIGLYMPMQDIWLPPYRETACAGYEKAGFELEQSQLYFDIMDDDVLAAADKDALADGMLRMGEACYTTIVIPPCRVMPEQSVAVLEAFIKGGGTVYTVAVTQEHPEKNKSMQWVKIVGAKEVAHCRGLLPQILYCSGDTQGIRMQERQLENGSLYLISNEAFQKAEICLEITEKIMQGRKLYLVNPTDGNVLEIQGFDGKLRLAMETGELFGLYLTEQDIPDRDQRKDAAHIYQNVTGKTNGAGSPAALTEVQTLKGPYQFRRTSRFRIGKMNWEKELLEEASREISLGDWRQTAGEEFSGSGLYSTSFRTEGMKRDLILDLGTVKYTCEVFLNGAFLGVKVMPPYRYVLPAELLKTENLLEIRVSNTAANEYLYTKEMDKWPAWQLGTYWEREKAFLPDSLPSGLFGPVRILELR